MFFGLLFAGLGRVRWGPLDGARGKGEFGLTHFQFVGSIRIIFSSVILINLNFFSQVKLGLFKFYNFLVLKYSMIKVKSFTFF